MSERAKRIEECARALLDGSEGIKLNAGTAEVMNYWNRYRGLRADLRAALSLPPDAPDEYRRGVADAARDLDRRVARCQELGSLARAEAFRQAAMSIRALVADAPPPAPGACVKCHGDGTREVGSVVVWICPNCNGRGTNSPPAPAPGARCERCGLCGGKGTVSMATAERPDLRRVCPACGGEKP